VSPQCSFHSSKLLVFVLCQAKKHLLLGHTDQAKRDCLDTLLTDAVMEEKWGSGRDKYIIERQLRLSRGDLSDAERQTGISIGLRVKRRNTCKEAEET